MSESRFAAVAELTVSTPVRYFRGAKGNSPAPSIDYGTGGRRRRFDASRRKAGCFMFRLVSYRNLPAVLLGILPIRGLSATAAHLVLFGPPAGSGRR